MKNHSETGHGINVCNLKKTIDTCKRFGSYYAPSNSEITIYNLTKKWQATLTLHESLTKLILQNKVITYERDALFKGLNKKITKVIGIVGSLKETDKFKFEVKLIADKIRGFNHVSKTNLATNLVQEEVRNYDLSFMIRTENYQCLIALLKSSPLYIPNENELKVESLFAEHAKMIALNEKIDYLSEQISLTRQARNEALYDKDMGALTTMKACRSYIKGIFGHHSPEYKLVSAIKFRPLAIKYKYENLEHA